MKKNNIIRQDKHKCSLLFDIKISSYITILTNNKYCEKDNIVMVKGK